MRLCVERLHAQRNPRLAKPRSVFPYGLRLRGYLCPVGPLPSRISRFGGTRGGGGCAGVPFCRSGLRGTGLDSCRVGMSGRHLIHNVRDNEQNGQDLAAAVVVVRGVSRSASHPPPAWGARSVGRRQFLQLAGPVHDHLDSWRPTGVGGRRLDHQEPSVGCHVVVDASEASTLVRQLDRRDSSASACLAACGLPGLAENGRVSDREGMGRQYATRRDLDAQSAGASRFSSSDQPSTTLMRVIGCRSTGFSIRNEPSGNTS